MFRKTVILFFAFFGFLASMSGQAKCPVKKIYAFKQASLPGVNPATTGKSETERKETFNYWIYLTLPPSKSIHINHIWLSGKKFSVTTEEIKTKPVTKINQMAGTAIETTELVPDTKHKVILIYPNGLQNDAIDLSVNLKKAIEENELVISFTRKEKQRTARKKLITVLAPEALL